MRDADKVIFRQVAFSQKVWILVRQTNANSLKYVGLPDYTPKAASCKAKTADSNLERRFAHSEPTDTGKGWWYELAGLVVNPKMFPEKVLTQIYKPNRIESVLKCWAAFTASHPLTPGSAYRVQDDPTSKHYGCVMANVAGYKYVHGDYDLKDVVEMDTEDWNVAIGEKTRTPIEQASGENEGGTLNIEGILLNRSLDEIQDLLNLGMGTPMVQHGYEAAFDGHQAEPINVFGPRGEECVLPDRSAVETFYATKFKGRRAGKVIYGGAGG
ncbi:MAG TPA: hypothetical protein VGF55_03210 [Gemmataceae bacterium]